MLTLTAAMLGLVVAQTTVRYAWARASRRMEEGLPFWVDLTLASVRVVLGNRIAREMSFNNLSNRRQKLRCRPARAASGVPLTPFTAA